MPLFCGDILDIPSLYGHLFLVSLIAACIRLPNFRVFYFRTEYGSTIGTKIHEPTPPKMEIALQESISLRLYFLFAKHKSVSGFDADLIENESVELDFPNGLTLRDSMNEGERLLTVKAGSVRCLKI